MEIRLTKEISKEKISTIILSFLKKEKVNYIFGIHGGYTIGFGNEMNNFPEIRFIRCQHEEGAAFMADGFARTSGKFGVVLTTAGPGLSNTFTGIISSFADGIPVMLLSGAIPKDKAFKGAIQDTESFNMNISLSIREATRFHADIFYKDSFLQYFRNGIRYLFKGKKGPVFFNIGAELFSSEIEHSQEYFRHYEDHFFDQIAADHIIEVIRSSRSMLIIAGHGVMQSNARDEVQNFAELLRVPVMVTPKGKSSFNHESQYFIGVFGAGSNIIPEEYLKNETIETILAIGTSFNEFSSNAWSSFLAKTEKIIQIDIDPYIIGRSFPNTYGIVGNAKTIINYLYNKIKNNKFNGFKHLDSEGKIKYYKQNFENILNPQLIKSGSVPLKVPRLLDDIYNSFYPYELNIFNDNGSCIFWVGHYLKLKKDWNYYISLGFSSMGYAIPAAIGGAIGAPARVTVAFTGDGAALMNGNELKTAAEYNVPVFFFVLNDARLGIVHHSTNIIYNKPVPGVSFSKSVNFVTFAQSLGVDAYRIEKPGDINLEFIKKLIEKKKPVLFDCIIDPEEIAPIGSRLNQVNK
ncbi:MAG TPA: thiamine pyrophosphate-binding protein [Bacteroidales bacterium]|nr:thiamine pyrophosphate-binding protein [Bacteroidales bacterium]